MPSEISSRYFIKPSSPLFLFFFLFFLLFFFFFLFFFPNRVVPPWIPIPLQGHETTCPNQLTTTPLLPPPYDAHLGVKRLLHPHGTGSSQTCGENPAYSSRNEPTKLTRQRRADKAYNDGLRQQTIKHHASNRTGRATRSVGGRMEIP